MDGESNDESVIPILPSCCFICNSPDAEMDINQTVTQATGSLLRELVQQLVPAGRDELQLLSAICAHCAAIVTEYDQLGAKRHQLQLYARQQYAASQAARASLDVLIELGDNRVSVPYGVYLQHRAAAAEAPPALSPRPPALSSPPPAVSAAAETPPPEGGAERPAESPPAEAAAPSPPRPESAAPRALDVEIHVEAGRLCHVCDAPFGRFAELAAHLREVHRLSSSEIDAVRSRPAAAPAAVVAARPVPCPLCEDRVFASAERTRRHLLRRHRAELEAGAGRCLPAPLALHLCTQCGAAFRRADMCRKHEATHRAKASAHSCQICGKKLRYRHSLKRHLQNQHGLAADHRAVAEAAAPAAKHPCDQCHQVFGDYGKYLFHCRTEHLDEPDVGFGCELCSRRFEKRSELLLHRDTHEETSYSCVTCEKHFRTRHAYQKHMRVHSGGGWMCQHCDKVFDTRPNLATHLQTHSARRRHVCGDCGAAFKFGQTLARHRVVRHSGVAPRYACDICGKAFPVEYSLKLHRSRHGPATLPCPHCQAKFANRPDQLRHIRRVHGAAAARADPLQRALVALAEGAGGTGDAATGVKLSVAL